MIKKEGSKYVLYSKDGSKKLGSFDSKKQAEEREAEINRIKHAKGEVSLVITKATLQEDGTMRWAAVCSDTATDKTGEATSLSLFQDWIERAESGKTLSFLPPPRKPFLGISHYPDLDGAGEAGQTDKMYIDGQAFKAAGTFNPDNPIGKALFEAVKTEKALIKKGETIAQPIRISAGWWDLAHSHGDFVFERKALTDACPMCENGAGDKVYLKGQVDHWAATRVPIQPLTDLALEEKAMAKTRKEDAASIVGDELAEELDSKAKPIGKSETEQLPEAMVVKADEPDVQKMPGDAEEFKPYGGAMTLAEADKYMETQEKNGQVISNWLKLQAIMDNILEISEPDDLKANVKNLFNEFNTKMEAIKASVEDAALIYTGEAKMSEQQAAPQTEEQAPEKTFEATVNEILNDNSLDREQKSQMLQEAFNKTAEAVKAQLDAVAPPDPSEQIAKGMAPIAEKLDLLIEKLSQQPQAPAQVPTQKSILPNGAPMQQKPQSSLTAMIRRSVGIVE